MIRIERPSVVPRHLIKHGPTAIQILCRDFDAAPADYRTGVKKLAINAKIYGNKQVKDALIAAQHGKCAFCESLLRHVAHGDIEHYRPKRGFQQSSTDIKPTPPGYYWLAYEWSNLLFGCQICNQSHKKNHFPLQNPKSRAASHNDDLSREKPLLIDPARESPEKFIAFREEFAIARKNSKKGRLTIDILGLNRLELVAERRKVRELILTASEALKIIEQTLLSEPTGTVQHQKLTQTRDALQQQLGHAILPQSAYAAMARALLK